MTEEIRNVTSEQFSAVDKLIAELPHEPNFLPLIPKMREDEGAQLVKYAKAVDIKIKFRGNKFDYDIMNVPSRKWNYKPVVKETVPILIDHQENDLSSKLGVQSLMVQEEMEANKELIDDIQEIILFGDKSVPGSEGMLNFTGLNSSAASGVWTTAKNFQGDLEIAIAYLRSKKVLPPYSLLMTPGIGSELRGNWIDNIGNEWKVAFEDIYTVASKNEQMPVLIDKFFFTDAICVDASGNKETLATDTQCFVLFKGSPNVCYIAETEPMGRKPLSNKKFEQDIAYAKIWGGTFIPKFADGIYLVYGGTTTTAY